MASPDTFTPEEVERRFQALPQDVQQAIYSANTNSALLAIGQKHQLHIDQLSTLEAQILFFVVGLIEPADFAKKLENRLGVNEETAKKISQDVDSEITGKIRASLKKPPVQAETHAAVSSIAPATPAPSRTIMPAQKELTGSDLRPTANIGTAPQPPATPARPSITSITRSAPPGSQPTTNNEQRTMNTLPPVPPKPATPAPQQTTYNKQLTTNTGAPATQQPSQTSAPIAPRSAPLPANLPGVPSSSQPITNNQQPITTAPAPHPVDPLRSINEKLSAPSLSATKTFDLSLGGQTPKPPASQPITDNRQQVTGASEPPAKKPYTKDPYREPVE